MLKLSYLGRVAFSIIALSLSKSLKGLLFTYSLYPSSPTTISVISQPIMKLTAAQLLLAGAVSGLPHMDSPRQRLLNGLELPDKFKMEETPGKGKPYTPEHRDPYDGAIDPIGEDLDPLPWRNGLGASVLGPWNKGRSKENPDLVRPPSTDHGNVANMRWSFADSHIRIEAS